jgi:hypothetical protein
MLSSIGAESLSMALKRRPTCFKYVSTLTLVAHTIRPASSNNQMLFLPSPLGVAFFFSCVYRPGGAAPSSEHCSFTHHVPPLHLSWVDHVLSTSRLRILDVHKHSQTRSFHSYHMSVHTYSNDNPSFDLHLAYSYALPHVGHTPCAPSP